MEMKERARTLLRDWHGDEYAFSLGVLDSAAEFAAQLGATTMVVSNAACPAPVYDRVVQGFAERGVSMVPANVVREAGPNAPREDVYRLETYILHYRPDVVVTIGGGSSMDAVKAASMPATLGTESPEIESYFGTGLVTAALERHGSGVGPEEAHRG